MNKICFVIDFDQTLTNENSSSIWDVVINSKYVSKYHNKEHNRMKDLMNLVLKENDAKSIQDDIEDWYKSALDLFKEYDDYKKVINDAINNNNNNLKFRDGVREFLSITNKYAYPVYIVSAALKDAISIFLEKNECMLSNIKIISNSPESNKIVTTVSKDKIIYNDEIKDSYIDSFKIIVIGDSLSDIEACPIEFIDKTLKIGFCNNKNIGKFDAYNKAFDLVLKNNKDFFDIIKIIETVK